MRATFRFVPLVFAVIFTASLAARQASPSETMLEAAKKLEIVDGNFADAIKQYQAVVDRFGKTDRATAAAALLRLAACYQKLGNGEAQKVYARLIRDFADQPAVVAEARAHVAVASALGSSGQGENYHSVWTLPAHTWITGIASSDGRFVAYGTTDALGVHDLLTGSDRIVASKTLSETSFLAHASAFSRDGRMLAYQTEIESGQDWKLQLRIVDLTRPGMPPSRVVLEADASPIDWTSDGKSIAVRHRTDTRASRTGPRSWEVGLVSVENGSLRVLKTYESQAGASFSGFLSPDGSQLAVEIPEDGSGARDVVVLPLHGGPEIRAVEFSGDDILLGWWPDGSGVLFSSARGSGSLAIWSQRIEAGRVTGQPEPVRSVGFSWPVGLTPAGALYACIESESSYSVKEATFDFHAGSFVSAPRDVSDTFVRSSRAPRWSPDGKLLGYISTRAERGRDVLVVRNLETGQSRDWLLDVSFRNDNRDLWGWAPDSQSIVAIGQNRDPALGQGHGIEGLYRVDLATGRTTLLVPRDLGSVHNSPLEWSADGRTLVFRYLAGPSHYVRVSRDLATGTERELGPRPGPGSPDSTKTYEGRAIPGGLVLVERNTASGADRELLRLVGNYDWRLAPDGRSIVAATTDLATDESLIVLYSIADGALKNLFRSARGQRIKIDLLARDAPSLLVEGQSRDGSSLFWWVPLDGRSPKPLPDLAGFQIVDTGLGHGFEVHGDGQRLAFGIENPTNASSQLFVLERFLPVRAR